MGVRRRVLTVAAGVLLAVSLEAKVFLTKEEALRLAFPDATVTRSTAFLTDAQRRDAQKLSGDPEPPAALAAFYTAVRDGRTVGTAYFDSHLVRTLPETIMVVVDPRGTIARIEVLSFDEPEDYLPRATWYGQFVGKPLDDEMSLTRAIRPVAGATLTARATTDAVRRVLALHRVLSSARPLAFADAMKRWEAWWNHAALAAVSLTGLAYGVARYFLHNPDPESRLGHPWQPGFEKAHILVAPLAVFGIGLLLRRHALARIRSGELNGRRTGVTMLWVALPLALSGYLVQVFTGAAATRWTGWSHAALGAAFVLAYAFHPKRRADSDTGTDE